MDSSNYSGLHYCGGVCGEYLHAISGDEVMEDWEVIKIERRKALEGVYVAANRLINALEQINKTLMDDHKTIRDVVNKQAEDEGLWFEAQTAPEAYLQQELRRLHTVIEELDNGL